MNHQTRMMINDDDISLHQRYKNITLSNALIDSCNSNHFITNITQNATFVCLNYVSVRVGICVCFLPKTQQKWIDQLEQSFPNNTDTQYILSILLYSYYISKHVFHQGFLRLKLPCLCITPIVQTNLKIRIKLFNAHSQRVLCSKLNSKPCLTIDIHRFLQLLCYDKSFKIPLAVQRTATILQTISFKLETSKLFPLSLSNFDFLWALRKRWGIEGPVAEK